MSCTHSKVLNTTEAILYMQAHGSVLKCKSCDQYVAYGDVQVPADLCLRVLRAGYSQEVKDAAAGRDVEEPVDAVSD